MTLGRKGRGFQVNKPARIFRFGQWVNMHYWTEEEDMLLRQEYRHSIESLRTLGKRLGVTENSVRQRLTRLGILRQAVRWTPSELEFLEENYNKKSNKVLAKLLHKSVNSVVAKAHRLQVKKRNRDGWFTKTEVANILGVDAGWITRRLKNAQCNLEMQPFDTDKLPKAGYYNSWKISEKSLRDFIRTYPEELTGCNVDFTMLVDILAGIKVLHH